VRMVVDDRMRVVPDHKCRSTNRNVFCATVKRAALDLGAFFLSGRLSFEQLVIKLADSIVPVLVFTEFRLGDAAECLLFQNIQLCVKKHYEFATDMLAIMGWHGEAFLASV
jgi:hypothetical protein